MSAFHPQPWRERLLVRTRRLAAAEHGSVAVLSALAFVVLIGMAALGVEITSLLLAQRQMQAAADGAAVAAAEAVLDGNAAGVTVEAQAIAAQDGYVPGVAGTTVTVASPPLSGAHTSDVNAFQVTVAQPQQPALLKLFMSGTIPVRATSVASIGAGGRYCLLTLDPSAGPALRVSNNAVITNPQCGAAVNSSSSTALRLDNNSAISGPVSVHGGISLGSGAYLNNASVMLGGPVFQDPYAGAPLAAPACTVNQILSGSGVINLNPGRYCKGWSIGNGATVNLQPGTYYIDAALSLGNTVTVNGMGGVTLVINGGYAIAMGNNIHMNLLAPTSGPLAGLAIAGPRNSNASVVQSFQNGAILNVTGAFYFPSQTVQFTNNGYVQSALCTQVIAQDILIYNNLQLNNNCYGVGVTALGASVNLVE